MRQRLAMQDELRSLTARAGGRPGPPRADAPCDCERGRIAEELQTLVANNVSAMVVQAGAVRPALAIPAPGHRGCGSGHDRGDRPRRAGRDAAAAGRAAPRRRRGRRWRPQPSLEQALIAGRARPRRRACRCSLQVDGEPSRAGHRRVDLAAYRVLQETLDSASRAEGGQRRQVLLAYGDRDVHGGGRRARRRSRPAPAGRRQPERAARARRPVRRHAARRPARGRATAFASARSLPLEARS